MVFRGVYTVFILVANTVGWREGVILIPKRIVGGRGDNVFGRFWGERDKLFCALH